MAITKEKLLFNRNISPIFGRSLECLGIYWLKNHLLKLIFFLVFSFLACDASAQTDNLKTDSTKNNKRARAKIRKKTAPEQRDSVLFTKIKNRMSANKLTRSIYGMLFRDVYNSNTKSQISVIEENPFQDFEGKIVRSISIKRLGVFGTSVYDTSRHAKSGFEKFANKLHISTRERVIRNSFLLFNVGDLVDPNVLKDNERLLRQQPFLHDARIYVEADSIKNNFVDVLIVTQDTWSLLPIVNYSSPKKFGLTLEHNNFNGQAHQIKTGFHYNALAIKQKTELFGRYTIPYIKKSLITAYADLQYSQPVHSIGAKVFRPFLTPYIKYAGAAELSLNHLTLFDKPRGIDSIFYFPINYNLSDIWLGRAFRLFFGDEKLKERSRIIIAARARKYTFTARPKLTNDSNQSYQNRRTYLINIGFSNRSYQRDVLIYGYGRTEDVPVGYLASFVAGIDNAELGRRKYLGVKLAHGGYLKNNNGYLYALLNIGSYFKNKLPEQGVLSAEGNYYSPIMNWGTTKIRQFITTNYTAGLHRFKTVEERLDISNDGIRGVRSDSLKGIRKLVFNFETVFFSRASIAGFRMAPYLFADFGLINFGEKPLFNGPLYSGFGLGIRLRNENLAFSTFQFRFGIYPNIPNINTFRTAFGGEQKLSFRDFDISAPEEISFGNSTFLVKK